MALAAVLGGVLVLGSPGVATAENPCIDPGDPAFATCVNPEPQIGIIDWYCLHDIRYCRPPWE